MNLKHFIFLNTLILAAFAFGIVYDSFNLLKNGNFEEGENSWKLAGALISSTAHDGKKALELNAADRTEKKASQEIKITAELKAVQISFWCKNNSSDATISIEFLNSQNSSTGKSTLKTFNGNDWKYYSKNVSIPKGSSQAVISIRASKGNAWLDELLIIEAPKQKMMVFENVEEELNPFKPLPPATISSSSNDSDNWLKNSGFETDMENWVPWSPDVSVSKTAHSGSNSLKISQENPQWMGATQYLDLPAGKNKVTLSGWIKTENVVQGANAWEKVITKIVFKDASGATISEGVAVEIIGTKDWKYFAKTFPVPAKTKSLEAICAFGNCTGTAYFDDLVLNDKDADFSAASMEVANGGFEEGMDSWNQWGAVPVAEAKIGKNAAFIENDDFKWTGCHQEFPIQKGLTVMEFSGWMKLEKVVGGKDDWEKAVYKMEYLDSKGNIISSNNIVQAVGTTDWIFYKKNIKVPSNASIAKITLALGNSKGKVWFDEIQVKAGTEEEYMAERAILINGGFEDGLAGWPDWAGEISDKAHSGTKSIVIKNDTKERTWIMRRQSVVIPKGVKSFKISAWVKLENAEKMTNGWEGARIYIQFKDQEGQAIPQTDAPFYKNDGTLDWHYAEQDISIPGPARELEVNIGLANAFGAIYADDVAIKFETLEEMSKGIKDGWYILEGKPEWYSGHYVDWSSLLDAPAGKHGFLKVNNGKEVFEDGTSAKFWGVNMTAEFCFLPKAKADSLANRYAKMGCNLVRFHHMEAPWSPRNLFGSGDAATTRKLNPERMDQLDYLIAAFKKKGIYVYLDLLVQRQFRPGDVPDGATTENGAKQVGVFDDKIIELEKEFNEQLFTHVNKYTNLAYKDDPVFIGSELVNETWIGGQWQGDCLTPYYAKKLDEKFEKSPFYAGKPRSILKQLPSLDMYCAQRLTAENKNSDSVNTMKFLLDLEEKYVVDMTRHLRSIGVKYPIAYTNMPYSFTGLLKNKSKGDIIINNSYWSHPWDYSLGSLSPTFIQSQLYRHKASLIVENCIYNVKGKPFMVTEWNACHPNPHRCDAIPLLTAYGSLQGWQNFTQFTMSDDANGANSLSPFGVANDPVHLAQWVVGAPLFLRGDVAEAKGLVRHAISSESVVQFPNQDPYLQNNYYLSYVTKFENTFDNDPVSKAEDYLKYVDLEKEKYTSETGELTLDGKALTFTVNTPKTQGVVAEFKGKEIELPFLKIKLENTYASVFAVSKDNLPLSESKNFYLVVTTNVAMKGQQWDENFRADWKAGGNGQLKKTGAFPMLAEIANGSVTIKKDLNPELVTIQPLSMYGTKMKTVSGVKTPAGLTIDLNSLRSFVVEITIK
jgi:hypothetical protein